MGVIKLVKKKYNNVNMKKEAKMHYTDIMGCPRIIVKP
jgi:hypothetical protein